ncbi:hypothetical protein H6P81_019600 [Aristolochia fimbriata]|uniref:Uncharacterized protein n=1 Tax=Aristolochia fimbriata TaxID=158543 RepID=A0AAV7DTR9_ARIFI|nr:hypothetical protein H6P81_019600 [Aristolochia fimbriata]
MPRKDGQTEGQREVQSQICLDGEILKAESQTCLEREAGGTQRACLERETERQRERERRKTHFSFRRRAVKRETGPNAVIAAAEFSSSYVQSNPILLMTCLPVSSSGGEWDAVKRTDFGRKKAEEKKRLTQAPLTPPKCLHVNPKL